MTVLNGKQTAPGGSRSPRLKRVTFDLVDGSGNPVRNAYVTATGDAIADSVDATVSSDGTYTITLPGHDGITPAGTLWRKTAVHDQGRPSTAHLLLPNTGGPYQERAIAVDIAASVAATPLSELDYAEHTAVVSGLAVNGFALVPIPELVVTVPDLARPCLIMCQLWMDHSIANAYMAGAIAAVGSNALGQQVAIDPAFIDTAGQAAGSTPIARRRPHSPGNFQAFVYGEAGTIDLQVSADDPGWINVVAI